MEVRCDQDFRPPGGLSGHIRSALEWIGQSDLEGIGFILLMEDIPEASKRADPDVIYASENQLSIFGAYRARSEDLAAHIILIVRSLYKPMPRPFVRTRGMTLRIAKTIAHEVGHHVRAEKRFALLRKSDSETLENEEEFAHRYASDVVTRMKSDERYKSGDKVLRLAASIRYYQGVRAWKKRKYLMAAEYFAMATDLQPDHAEANYWYWEARKKVN